MELEASYQLLGVLRDDGIRTYDAVEIASGQAMQVHLFARPDAESDRALYKALRALPASKRRELLDMGMESDMPYIVTDKLPDGSTPREWLAQLAGLPAAPAKSPGPITLAGSWKTGTPIPEELIRASHAAHPPRQPPSVKPAELTPDYTRVMRLPQNLDDTPPTPPPAPPVTPPPGATLHTAVFKPEAFPPKPEPAPPLPPPPPPEPVSPPPPQREPGEFTRMFLANRPHEATTPAVPQEPAPPQPLVAETPAKEPGEFTRMFRASQPQEPAPPPPPPVKPASEESTRLFQSVSPAAPPPPPPSSREPGEFTRMFPPARTESPTPTPVVPQSPPPSSDGGSEFTRYFQSPIYPTPAGNQKAPTAPQLTPQPASSRSTNQPGEFTQMFGNPNRPAEPWTATPPPQVQPLGSPSSATGAFSMPKAASFPPPSRSAEPGEFTRMMAATAPPTLGQPSKSAAPPPASPTKSMMPLYIAAGAALLAIILVILFFVLRH